MIRNCEAIQDTVLSNPLFFFSLFQIFFSPLVLNHPKSTVFCLCIVSGISLRLLIQQSRYNTIYIVVTLISIITDKDYGNMFRLVLAFRKDITNLQFQLYCS